MPRIKFALLLLPVLLTACAPKLPAPLNTRLWAIQTEQVFALPRAQSTCDGLKQFIPLRDAQAAITPTNLVLRTDVAEAGCRNDEKAYARAWNTLQTMSRGGYWPEGKSYWDYTRTSFDWYGHTEAQSEYVDWVDSNYAKLIAPDGTIPIPETSAETHPVGDREAYFQDGHYLVKRWPGNYLLVVLDTNLEPRLNFHRHGDCGMVAYYRNGVWISRPAPYAGYDPTAIFSDEAKFIPVPKGVFIPDWRLGAVKCSALEVGPARVVIEYHRPGLTVTRTVEIGDSVTVKDKGE